MLTVYYIIAYIFLYDHNLTILIIILGKSWQDKILALRKFLKARSATAVILQKLDEIACK